MSEIYPTARAVWYNWKYESVFIEFVQKHTNNFYVTVLETNTRTYNNNQLTLDAATAVAGAVVVVVVDDDDDDDDDDYMIRQFFVESILWE